MDLSQGDTGLSTLCRAERGKEGGRSAEAKTDKLQSILWFELSVLKVVDTGYWVYLKYQLS